MSNIRIGIVGFGQWGKKIFLTLNSIVDVDTIILKRDDIYFNKLDGVIIATPSSAHFDVALPFIKRGVPTFIEKPMVVSIDQYREIEKVILKHRTPVSVGYINLFNPYIREIPRIFPDFNKVQLIGHSIYHRIDSSVLWDWLPHDLIIIKLLCGEFPSFQSGVGFKGANYIESAVLKFRAKNIDFCSDISWTTTKARRTIALSNDKKDLSYDDKNKKIITNGIRGGFELLDPDIQPLRQELLEFIHTIKNNSFSLKYLELTQAITFLISQVERNIKIKFF